VEKHVIKWSYWLGLACVVIAFIMRGLNAVGVVGPDFLWRENIGAMSFYKAALLFLAVAIATASMMWSQAKKE
jgi:hypothetical protein